MKTIVWVVGLIVAGLVSIAYLDYAREQADFREWDARRTAWHLRCDRYTDAPGPADEVLDCERETEELMAYHRKRGWTKE